MRSSLLLWGATAASVADDTCHAAAAGRQNGDMWEGGKQGGEPGRTKVIPVSAFGNAALNVRFINSASILLKWQQVAARLWKMEEHCLCSDICIFFFN